MSIAKSELRKGLEKVGATRLEDRKGKEVWIMPNDAQVIQMNSGNDRMEEGEAIDLFETMGLGRWYYDDLLV